MDPLESMPLRPFITYIVYEQKIFGEVQEDKQINTQTIKPSYNCSMRILFNRRKKTVMFDVIEGSGDETFHQPYEFEVGLLGEPGTILPFMFLGDKQTNKLKI